MADYVADAHALLALFQGEPGGVLVNTILGDFSNRIHLSAIDLGEILYIIERRRGPTAADTVEQTIRSQANLSVHGSDWNRIRAAATIKAEGRMSFADAFAAQLAMELDAPLLTGDPEFAQLEAQGRLQIRWLLQR